MEITVLQSWDDFRIELEKLAQIRESLKNNLTYPDIWVFRGQTRAWDLDTTYERKTRVNEYSMRGYLDLMKRVCPEIKACKTSISWAALDLPEYADGIKTGMYSGHRDYGPT